MRAAVGRGGAGGAGAPVGRHVRCVRGWAGRPGGPGGCQRLGAAVRGRAVPLAVSPPPQPGAAAGGGPAGAILHNLREVLEEQAAEAKKSDFGKETGKSWSESAVGL